MLLKVSQGQGCLHTLTVDEAGTKTNAIVPFRNWFYIDAVGGNMVKNAIVSPQDVVSIEQVQRKTLTSPSANLIKITHKANVTRKHVTNLPLMTYDIHVPNDLRWRLEHGHVQSTMNRVMFCRYHQGQYYHIDAHGNMFVSMSWHEFENTIKDIDLVVFWDEVDMRAAKKSKLHGHAVLYMRLMLNNWLKKDMYEFIDHVTYTHMLVNPTNMADSVKVMREVMIDKKLLAMLLSSNTLTNTVIEDYNRPDIAMYSLFALIVTTCMAMDTAINSHFMTDKQSAIKGGLSFPAVRHIHENVAMFDYKSTYPSAILDHGFDFAHTELKVSDHKETTVFYTAIKKLLDERERIKRIPSEKHKEKAIKCITNKIYGMLGAKQNCQGLTCNKLANAITLAGRTLNSRLIKYAESQGLKVIFADTDCIMAIGFSASLTPQMFVDGYNRMLRTEGYVFTTLNYERMMKKCLVYANKWWCGQVGDVFISKGPLGVSYCDGVKHAFEGAMREIFTMSIDVTRGQALDILNRCVAPHFD